MAHETNKTLDQANLVRDKDLLMSEMHDAVRYDNCKAKEFIERWADALGREVAGAEEGKPSLALEKAIAWELYQ